MILIFVVMTMLVRYLHLLDGVTVCEPGPRVTLPGVPAAPFVHGKRFWWISRGIVFSNLSFDKRLEPKDWYGSDYPSYIYKCVITLSYHASCHIGGSVGQHAELL